MSKRRRRRGYDPLAPLSPKELRRQADLLLNSSLARPRQQISRAQQEARQQAQDDALTIQGFAKALGGLLQPTGAAVDKTYSDAVNRQQRVAQGYSMGQRLAEQNSADKANALLSGSGQHVNAGPAANVTYALGGIGPANALNQAGAAFSAAAHNLPGMVAGRGQEELSQRLALGQKEQEKFRAQLEDLMSRAPGLRQEIMDKLYQRELSKRAQQTQQDYLGVSQFNAQTSRDESINPDTGRPYNVNANGVPFSALPPPGGGKKARDAAREKRLGALDAAREKSYDAASELYKGREVTLPSGLPGVDRPTPKEAYANLWARYGQPILRLAPPKDRAWWKRKIEAMIVTTMTQAGFAKPPKKPPRNRKITRPGPS